MWVTTLCSAAAGENEANVQYLLRRYPCLALVPQAPRLGQAGLTGTYTHADGQTEAWLPEELAALVQRFEPTGPLDTIGFFIAKFRKQHSLLVQVEQQ